MDKRTFYPYLDDFDELTIIIPFKNYRDNNSYLLLGNDEVITINIDQKINLGSEVKLVCSFDAYIDLGKKYMVENEEKEQSELYTGKIVRTELFDNIYNYKKNDLGYTYQKQSTKFKIWTPVAKTVTLELLNNQDELFEYEMLYTNSGVWRILLDGDYEGFRYRYRVYVNGKEQIVTDPYANASTPFAEYSVVVDFSKTYQMKHPRPFQGEIEDAIIYETSVRDFSMDPLIPFEHRGKFLGLVEKNLKTENGNPAGFDYLKELGITHLQLMPIFDFDGVDELDPNGKYNWGYNPRQYNVLQGWYSTNPSDPYNRINEFKKTVDLFHENGISVVMDVVYNHVFDPEAFSIEKLVPGYLYHVDREGMYTNVSGCHNDLATYRKMVRKMIIDSVLFWVNEYKIDGFRFDLMGLIDYETMNEIRQELHSVSNHLIVYGEGWKMYSSNQADRMAHMYNKNVLHTIGFFNDSFRESIKGDTFHPESKGYAFGNFTKLSTVKNMLLGSASNRFMFKYASQSINYVECHDNHTFFDKGLHVTSDIAVIKAAQKLATSMVLLSEGVPFIHSGQEFYRTKKDVENSYISSDEINMIHWNQVDESIDDISFIKQLIQIRKAHKGFHYKTNSDLSQFVDVVVLQSGSIMMSINSVDNLIIIFKPTKNPETFCLCETYRILASSSEQITTVDHITFDVLGISTIVLKKDVK